MQLGRLSVSLHTLGTFGLDGGSMFGSVPKPLWEKRIPADARNRIPLAARVMRIVDGARVFLVDVGMGEKWNDKERDIFAIQNKPVSQWGFDPKTVTDIILTHLHFDHAGGISSWVDVEKKLAVLTYPTARVHLQRANLENARTPNVKERASYLPENVEVFQPELLTLYDRMAEIVPGIRLHRVDGHTVGQQWVEVTDGKETLMYATDLIPTAHHVPLPWHMGYDICAGTLLKEKLAFLELAVERNAIVIFEHDIDTPAARISRDEKGQFSVGERLLTGWGS